MSERFDKSELFDFLSVFFHGLVTNTSAYKVCCAIIKWIFPVKWKKKGGISFDEAMHPKEKIFVIN